MSIPLTKQQVDAAPPLDFKERQPRQELTIAIRCRVEGFETEITFNGDIDQLKRVAAKLAALGIEPASSAPAAPQPERKAAKRVQPAYDGDGEPCCPVHKRKLSEGQYGLYCSAKAAAGDVSDKRGYCGLKFE